MIVVLNLTLLLLCSSIWGRPQDVQPLERDLIPERFIKARPAKPSAPRSRRISYRRVNSSSSGKAGPKSATQLGLTIWRLRRATAAEVGERIIVQDNGQTVEWVPERVEAGRPLRIGEKIRISFESQQAGYLYVINREQYASGALGEPLLIFPTTRTRNGENRVAAGRLIEIPAQDDRPNFFTMRQTRMDQVGEQLIALVTPQPLTDLTITEKPLRLTDEVVSKWEQEWGAKTERFEMATGGGKAWTKVEQEAGANAAHQLTQDDPGPQTIFRIAAGPDQPRLIKVILRYVTRPQ